MYLSELIEQLIAIRKELKEDPLVAVSILASDKDLGYFPSTKTRMINFIRGNSND